LRGLLVGMPFDTCVVVLVVGIQQLLVCLAALLPCGFVFYRTLAALLILAKTGEKPAA
jgi:hypothetical protein